MYKLENLQFNLKLKTFNCERSNDRQRQSKQNRLQKPRITSTLITNLEVYIDDQDLWNYFIFTFKICIKTSQKSEKKEFPNKKIVVHVIIKFKY